jgi:hypothetical protein
VIRWTAAGAVADPEIVQIRISPEFQGRVGVGAPVPKRAMTVSEVRDNITHFAVTRSGPRTPGCRALVLSGVRAQDDFLDVVDFARRLGISTITLHCGGDLALAHSELAALCDAVAVSVRGVEEAEAIPQGSHAVVLLEQVGLTRDMCTALIGSKPARVTLTWPFPGGPVPPSVSDLAPGIRVALDDLAAAGIAAGVKGVPLCALAPGPLAGRWSNRVWRSPNRWYVDAAHQCAEALAFFPDVVRFMKLDSCRFCSANRRCDGVAEAWIHMGLAGPLTPVPFGG